MYYFKIYFLYYFKYYSWHISTPFSTQVRLDHVWPFSLYNYKAIKQFHKHNEPVTTEPALLRIFKDAAFLQVAAELSKLYRLMLVSRLVAVPSSSSTESKVKRPGSASRASHTDVSFCSWSNTSTAAPPSVLICSGSVSTSSVSTCWEPTHVFSAGKQGFGTFGAFGRTVPGRWRGARPRTRCCWTCRRWPRSSPVGWGAWRWPGAARCCRSSFSTGAGSLSSPAGPPEKEADSCDLD